MKNTITNPLANIPSNSKSHTYGWSFCWSEILGAEINHKCTKSILNHETVYIDHGVNFKGSLNLFGGLNKDIYEKFNTVMKHKNVVSLDHDMPDYGLLFKQRLNAKSTYEKITENWCNQVTEFCKNIDSIKYSDYNLLEFNGLTYGDSHSIAFSKRYDSILRKDGSTLYGLLKRKHWFDYIKVPKNIVRMTLCFGSIDIRHHIIRNNTDWKEMLNTLIKGSYELQKRHNIRVELACPVPVEYQFRRIPKTGFYKGTPFFGSEAERRDLTNEWRRYLLQNYRHVVSPPPHWYTMDSEKYAKEIMELSSSVHISPTHYRRKDWGRFLEDDS